MKPLGHAIISLTVGSILYKFNPSLVNFLWFLIWGIFIDVDHYFDYVREKGISFNFRKVYAACKDHYSSFKKTTLVLHSHELTMLLWLAIAVFNLDNAWKYAAMGYTLHVFIDQVVNPTTPFAYFIVFRIAHRFKTDKIIHSHKGGTNVNRHGKQTI